MLSTIRAILRILVVLNWVFVVVFAVVAVVLASSGAAAGMMADRFGAQAEAIRHYLMVALLLGAATGLPAHVLLTRLHGIVTSVGAGTPFLAVNADRIRTMGWAMLVLQLIDLVYGLVSQRTSIATGEYFGWSFSLGAWLSILMLFVLARVFRHGAALQDEVEATV